MNVQSDRARATRAANASVVHLMAWVHAVATCIALCSYAASSTTFSNFFWLAFCFDLLCPLSFVGVLSKGHDMVILCQALAGALSLAKLVALVLAVGALARHVKTACCGDVTIHLIVVVVCGTVSETLSVLELLMSDAAATKAHNR